MAKPTKLGADRKEIETAIRKAKAKDFHDKDFQKRLTATLLALPENEREAIERLADRRLIESGGVRPEPVKR